MSVYLNGVDITATAGALVIHDTDIKADVGDWSAQTNLQTLLAGLGIPDVSAKPLYTCLVTDRLDHATYGLSALHTDIIAIPTTMVGTDGAFLASVGGLLTTAAATGAVGTGTTLMGYGKQLVTAILDGTYGLSALHTDIAAIPTTMRGTDSAFLASVGGLLTTVAATGAVGTGTTSMGYQKQLVTNSEMLAHHSQLFTGDVFYVDASMAGDTLDGHTPDTAKKTIGAAIGVASAGDAIIVKAGTYTELAINMNLASLEMYFEIGAVIDPVSGTAFTVSANYCKISGNVDIDVPTSQIGLLLTTGANYCEISDCTILNGGTGVNVLGAGNLFRRMAAGLQTVYGYDIDGAQTRLYNSHTVGIGASIGYNIGGGADVGVIEGCTSANHQTSGFTIETGCANWTILDCSSGGGDGRWSDADNANVWSNFSYDDEVFKEIDMTDATAAFDLFTITGIVEVEFLRGHVEEPTNAELGDCKFRVHGTDGPTNTDLTGATDCENLPAGSLIAKIADASVAVTVVSSAAPAVVENTSYKDPTVSAIIVADNTGTTTVQFFSDDSAGNKDGVIHFHCKWSPVSDNGFLQAA